MKTFIKHLMTFTFMITALSMSQSTYANDSTPIIKVDTVGSGQPVILIPGLMSDGSVWQSTAKALSKNYQVHIVNVAGFGATPETEGTTARNIEQAIVDYIHQEKLHSPVVIGHSFGGFIALALTVNPQVAIKKTISVDGLPFIGPVFTRTNATTPEDLRPQALQIRNLYRQLNREQLLAQTQLGIAIQATSKEAQQNVLDLAAQSDPATVGQITHDLMVRDLRPLLAGDNTPILLLGASGAFTNQAEHAYAKSLYEEQLAQAPHARVIMNTESRHFIMFDDPTWLNNHITAFLGE
ncbi:alpha/beta fold hydrolase [Alteromonas antoniana]|uniref:alpha/beta fold hydrolase n=1 Tax=Alteromonas antoniana TaxID=2803813 RepID=UPI001C47AC74|nr:alpha/beta hydrolase [Alteromonas antoniana]